MAFTRRSMILGTAAGASALTLAACGGGDGGDGGGGGTGEPVYARNIEPQNPLVPTNTNEVGGGNVVDLAFSGLVYYLEDGQVEMDLAESVESEDNQTWTVKLREGLTFSDGSELTAQSFVDAWNYGALSTNAQLGQSFFEPIEGFDEVGAAEPTAEELSGLTVEDETTFTITLVSEQADFVTRLGYAAYSPLPASAFDDMEAFGEKPVGSGPYMVENWEHDQEIVLVPNPEYDGPRTAQNGGVTFLVYEDPDTMYNDFNGGTGELDVIDTIPDSAIESFEDELGELAINQPGALYQTITLPESNEGFSGEAGNLRRKALSRAIDRAAICDNLFFGTRTPATDFVAPTVPGGGADDIEGAEVLEYDEAEATSLWEQAEEIEPYEGEFVLSYNADDANKGWVEAVCNSIKNALGIEATPNPIPSFSEFRDQITSRDIKGAFRSGWQADYPSMYNFLSPLYSSAAADGNGSNDGDYKNEEFDELLAEGLAAADEDAAIEAWKKAQAILMEDLPVIPLWYQNAFGAHSDAVQDVTFGWNTVPLYAQITK